MFKKKILIILASFILISMTLEQPYYFDKLTTTSIDRNYVFDKHAQSTDGTKKYVPHSAFYLKNTVDSGTDPVIEDKRSSLGFVSYSPTVG